MDLFIKDQRSLVYLQSSRGCMGQAWFSCGVAHCGLRVLCVCVCVWGGGGCTAGGVQFLLGARQ